MGGKEQAGPLLSGELNKRAGEIVKNLGDSGGKLRDLAGGLGGLFRKIFAPEKIKTAAEIYIKNSTRYDFLTKTHTIAEADPTLILAKKFIRG